MHPNTFLKTFWQLEVKPQIFVAMSFAPEYRERYEQVIVPAISSIPVNGRLFLTPCRVDISKSGDSILTDIMEGVSHSQMVLADVSSVGKDSKTGVSYRNGNVMYEVGLALACRQPSDVLLVRDDKEGRGGSGWLDSVTPSLSGTWRVADYAAVRRVVRLS